MAEYHVGCGLAGIYVGILKPNGYEWRNKTEATKEAMGAVAQYMVENKKEFKFSYRGKNMTLKVEED